MNSDPGGAGGVSIFNRPTGMSPRFVDLTCLCLYHVKLHGAQRRAARQAGAA